jgi:hypothetical protein
MPNQTLFGDNLTWVNYSDYNIHGDPNIKDIVSFIGLFVDKITQIPKDSFTQKTFKILIFTHQKNKLTIARTLINLFGGKFTNHLQSTYGFDTTYLMDYTSKFRYDDDSTDRKIIFKIYFSSELSEFPLDGEIWDIFISHSCLWLGLDGISEMKKYEDKYIHKDKTGFKVKNGINSNIIESHNVLMFNYLY